MINVGRLFVRKIMDKNELIKEYNTNCRRYGWNDPFDFMEIYIANLEFSLPILAYNKAIEHSASVVDAQKSWNAYTFKELAETIRSLKIKGNI